MDELGKLPDRFSQLSIYFPIYFVYTWAYVTMYLCIAIVEDKYRKIKDHLVMMGLRSSAYW